MCRLHALLAELVPGGLAKELYVSDAERFLANITPQSPAEQVRYDMALELLDDVRRLDDQTKASHRRIRRAIKASGTSLTELYGVGPIVAAELIGYAGDVRRFANRDAFASYNGTAPVEFASGGRVVHRVSQRGNRRLNHASAHGRRHPDPQSWDRGTHLLRAQGRRGQDQERGAPFTEAPDQQRRLPPAPLRRSIRGPGGHQGTTRSLRDRLYTLNGRLFGEVTPEPKETLRRRVVPCRPIRRAQTASKLGS